MNRAFGNTRWWHVFQHPRVMNVLTIGTVLALGIFYVGQVNASATKGYAMRDLEQENRALQQECDQLEMEIAHLRSVDSIRTREVFLGFQKIDQVRFLKDVTLPPL